MSVVLSNVANAAKYSLVGKRVCVHNMNGDIVDVTGKVVFQNEIGIYIEDENMASSTVFIPMSAIALMQLLND